MEKQPRLTGIANDREITRTRDPQFWHTCQQALLLALKEEGLLSEAQYRQGESALRARLPAAPEEGGEP